MVNTADTVEARATAIDIASATYAPGPHPHVSVVIATHCRPGFLRGLFDSLTAQTFRTDDFEVVAVDDASPDGTWATLLDLVAATPLRAAAVRLPANVGQGAARNVGVELSRGDVIAFTDDDCLPDGEWLARLTGPFSDGPRPVAVPRSGGPEPVIVQGRTEAWRDGPDGGPWDRTVWILRPSWLFETCNIAYRRADLLGAGLFPDRHGAEISPDGRIVGEDAITGWKVVTRGAQLVFEPRARVYHRLIPSTYGEWLAEKRGCECFPSLVSRDRLGAAALWHRHFLSRRSAAFDLAVVAIASGTIRRKPLLLALCAPWVFSALPEARDRKGEHALLRLAQLALGDLVVLISLLRGSFRNRRLVL